MRTIHTSETPRYAPANFRDLEPVVQTKDGEGLYGQWHGSGVPSTERCAACENVEGNKKIYSNWGHSYPNGNSWDDREILCGRCGTFTAILDFTEG